MTGGFSEKYTLMQNESVMKSDVLIIHLFESFLALKKSKMKRSD